MGDLAFLQFEARSSQVSQGQDVRRVDLHPPKGPIYDGCYSSKECIGSSPECVTNGDCNHMATWRKKGERYLFEVQAKTDGYVAMGLSTDTAMVSH